MKKIVIAALASITVFASCEKTKTAEIDHTQHAVETHQLTDEVTHSVDQTAKISGLELDNGNKWKTNAEMAPYVLEQEKLLDKFDNDRDDYKELAANLSTANEKLLKSCTMTGKSHEVLHVWLTDHMKNIGLLAKAETKEEADNFLNLLEDSMETYHQYFD